MAALLLQPQPPMGPTVTLEQNVTVRDVARACRAALEKFASLDPSHFALAHWLATSYRRALVGRCPPRRFPLLFMAPLENVVEDAQRRLACAEKQARRRAWFLDQADERVGIVRVRDESGHLGFAAVDVRGASLTARVMSLFVADQLVRSEHGLPTVPVV